VLVHKFICRGTVEEQIAEMMASKQRLSEEILAGGADAAITELSDSELIDLVSLDIHRAVQE
jgi:SNF2 family DNA or RNA helicase